jgi:hypothetical protein
MNDDDFLASPVAPNEVHALLQRLGRSTGGAAGIYSFRDLAGATGVPPRLLAWMVADLRRDPRISEFDQDSLVAGRVCLPPADMKAVERRYRRLIFGAFTKEDMRRSASYIMTLGGLCLFLVYSLAFHLLILWCIEQWHPFGLTLR